MSTQELKSKILGHYTDHVLESEAYPKSVFKFCKEAKIEEKEFYSVFSSLDAIREHIWEAFYSNTMTVLEKDKNFKKAPRKEKLLSFVNVKDLSNNPTIVTNIRHYEELQLTLNEIKTIKNELDKNISEIF